MDTIYLIPQQNLQRLQQRLDELVNRTQKKGLAGILRYQVRADQMFTVGMRDPYNLEHQLKVAYYPVYLSASVPKYEGWTFVATLQRLYGAEAGTILRAVPGTTADLSKWKKEFIPAWCDHCQTIRERKDTYIVQHEDGTIKEVGSSCIRDFLGHVNPNTLAQHLGHLFTVHATMSEHEEFGAGGASSNPTYDVEHFLAYAAQAVLDHGWVSRQKSRAEDIDSTADVARDGFDYHVRHIRPSVRSWWFTPPPTPSEQAVDIARRVMELGQEPLREDDNDWLYNVTTLLRVGVMELRNAGLVASAVLLYFRQVWDAERRDREAARFAADAASTWIGEVGKRQEFGKVTLTNIFPTESDFGPVFIHTFKDEAGNVLKWFTGTLHDEGEYQLKGTVKRHTEYKGVKETHLNRCKLTAA